jgi:hypothetical protein
MDLVNDIISVRFYQRDGAKGSLLGGPSLVSSRFFNFTLEKQERLGLRK